MLVVDGESTVSENVGDGVGVVAGRDGIVSENGDGGVVDLGLDRKGGYVRDCIVR